MGDWVSEKFIGKTFGSLTDIGSILLPGDKISYNNNISSRSHNNINHHRTTISGDLDYEGSGRSNSDDYEVEVRTAGILVKQRAGEDINKTVLINSRKKYTPKVDDLVIGIVIGKHAEEFLVDIGCAFTAYLPLLSFIGASKKNHPTLPLLSHLYARIHKYDVRTSIIELSCVYHADTKSWSSFQNYLGPLSSAKRGVSEGLLSTVPLAQADSLMSSGNYVLERLGESIGYEICIGRNGRVWIRSTDPSTTSKINFIICSSYGLSKVEVELLIERFHFHEG